MINFNQISSSLRVPIVAVEFDSSKAQQGPALLSYKGFIVGQKLNTGAAAADSIVRCTSVDQAIVIGGRGSMIHRQALSWFAVNKTTELWIGVLADNAGGTAATGTIAVTAAATADGSIPLYVGGQLVPVAVHAGDATTAIAAAIAAAINALPDLPVTATVTASTVTITFRHKGTPGNGYDLRTGYNGESLPAGVALTCASLASGVTNPLLTNLIAAIADLWLMIWAHGYTDATSLSAIEAELARRAGPMVQQMGVAIASAVGTFSTLAALGAGRNSQYSVIVAQTGQTPVTPTFEFAAEVAALVAAAGADDPARPFQSLAMVHALPAPETDQWSPDERNLFLFTGIATTKRVAGGIVQLERMITTYQTAPSGEADPSYLDVNTPLTLMYLRYSFRVRIQLKYPRHKLADDGNQFGAGQDVMTPMLGKAEAIGWFKEMLALGLVENLTQFKRDLVVVRNAIDRNRLDFLLPPDLINQLVVVGAQIQFLL